MATIRISAIMAGLLLTAPLAYASEPALTAGRVLTPSVDVAKPPGQAAVSLTLARGTVGISALEVTLASPSGLHSITAFISLPNPPAEPAHQTIDVQVSSPFANGGLNLYSEPGTWTLSSVLLFSKDNMLIGYSGAQLTALFPSVSVTVTNEGTPDTKAPAIGQGTILTPTISLSSATPYFAARLAVADAISGVATAFISFMPQSGAPGSGSSAALTTLAPLKQGNVTLYSQPFPSNSALGTYTITNYTVCDYAQNCTNNTDEAQIQQKFGTTTFQVTK